MSPKRATLVLSILLVLVIAAGAGAFYLGDKMLQERSAEISDEKAELEAVNTAISIFQDSQKKVNTYEYVNDLSSKILPDSKSQSEVVAELTKFATKSNMKIQALTFGAGDATQTDPNLSQTEKVEGLAGVRVLNASLSFASEPAIVYSNFLLFLNQIETNQRKMEVTTLTITPNLDDPNTISAATVTINIFLKDAVKAPEVKEQ